VQPIVIWFGRVGGPDPAVSALLENPASAAFGLPCSRDRAARHTGPAEDLRGSRADVGGACRAPASLHRRGLSTRALGGVTLAGRCAPSRAGPVYVCEDPYAAASSQESGALLRFQRATDPARCVFLDRRPTPPVQNCADALGRTAWVSFGRAGRTPWSRGVRSNAQGLPVAGARASLARPLLTVVRPWAARGPECAAWLRERARLARPDTDYWLQPGQTRPHHGVARRLAHLRTRTTKAWPLRALGAGAAAPDPCTSCRRRFNRAVPAAAPRESQRLLRSGSPAAVQACRQGWWAARAAVCRALLRLCVRGRTAIDSPSTPVLCARGAAAARPCRWWCSCSAGRPPPSSSGLPPQARAASPVIGRRPGTGRSPLASIRFPWETVFGGVVVAPGRGGGRTRRQARRPYPRPSRTTPLRSTAARAQTAPVTVAQAEKRAIGGRLFGRSTARARRRDMRSRIGIETARGARCEVAPGSRPPQPRRPAHPPRPRRAGTPGVEAQAPAAGFADDFQRPRRNRELSTGVTQGVGIRRTPGPEGPPEITKVGKEGKEGAQPPARAPSGVDAGASEAAGRGNSTPRAAIVAARRPGSPGFPHPPGPVSQIRAMRALEAGA